MSKIREGLAGAEPGLPADEGTGASLGPSRPALVRAGAELAGRSYAWIVAPLVAVVLVVWGMSEPLWQLTGQHQAAAVGAIYLGSAVLSVTPGVAVLSVFARYTRLGPATALGLLLAGSGVTALAGFWAWFASPAFGRGADVGLLAASVIVIAVFGRRGDLRSFGLTVPLMLALATGLACTGLAFVQGNGMGSNAVRVISTRFWRAGDNELPLLFAIKVAAHAPLNGKLISDWLSSDRPPLQTGYTLLLWPLWRRGDTSTAAGYQLLCTGLATSWLPALWMVLRVRGIATWRVAVAVVATALTGFVFISTVYVWPKMLAGTFALGALAIIVSRDEADRKKGTGILAVVLLTISMLSHGGTAFAVIALIPFGWRLRRRITIRGLAACAAALIALYLPWALYQRFVDPPGDRLLKWQLAGMIPVTTGSFFHTLSAQYGSLSFQHVLVNKLTNLYTLVANPHIWTTQGAEPAWRSGFLGFARVAQVYDTVPAAGVLLLGGAALLIPSARRRLADVKPLAVFTGLGLLAWVVLLWGGDSVPAINHQGAYALTVMFIGLCAVAVTALPWPLMTLVLAGSAAWFAVSWIPGLGFVPAVRHLAAPGSAPWAQSVLTIVSAQQLSPAMLALCLAGVALLAVALGWLIFTTRRAAAIRDKTALATIDPESASSLPNAHGALQARLHFCLCRS
jgi:hypothetical protein